MQQKMKRMKKRKNKLKLLLTDYEQIEIKDLLATIKEMRQRLKILFKFHIGFENSTSPAEIFINIFEVNPETLDPYMRSYWWRVLQKIMGTLRHDNDLFIVHKGHKYFVLQTQEESNYYKNCLKRTIIGLEKSMQRADAWVRERKYLTV